MTLEKGIKRKGEILVDNNAKRAGKHDMCDEMVSLSIGNTTAVAKEQADAVDSVVCGLVSLKLCVCTGSDSCSSSSELPGDRFSTSSTQPQPPNSSCVQPSMESSTAV